MGAEKNTDTDPIKDLHDPLLRAWWATKHTISVVAVVWSDLWVWPALILLTAPLTPWWGTLLATGAVAAILTASWRRLRDEISANLRETLNHAITWRWQLAGLDDNKHPTLERLEFGDPLPLTTWWRLARRHRGRIYPVVDLAITIRRHPDNSSGKPGQQEDTWLKKFAEAERRRRRFAAVTLDTDPLDTNVDILRLTQRGAPAQVTLADPIDRELADAAR